MADQRFHSDRGDDENGDDGITLWQRVKLMRIRTLVMILLTTAGIGILIMVGGILGWNFGSVLEWAARNLGSPRTWVENHRTLVLYGIAALALLVVLYGLMSRRVFAYSASGLGILGILFGIGYYIVGDDEAEKPELAAAEEDPDTANEGLRELEPLSPANATRTITGRAFTPVEPPPSDSDSAPVSPTGQSRKIVDTTAPVRTLGCAILEFTERGVRPACDWFKVRGSLTPSMVSGYTNLELEYTETDGRVVMSQPKPVKLFKTGDIGPVEFFATASR